MRLQKFIARTGYCSRRNAEIFISENKVVVNSKVVNEPWYQVKPEDEVFVDGVRITPEENKVYIMINKPAGYISSVKDQFGRKNVIMLIEGVSERLFPVGRLDYDTTGLLLLTNDGDFAYKLTHPKHEISKVYEAWISGILSEDEIKRFEDGLFIDGYKTAPAKINLIDRAGNRSKVVIEIHEGKNRQVKKMCEDIGHPVLSLSRIKIGGLELGSLKCGSWRYLAQDDIERIFI